MIESFLIKSSCLEKKRSWKNLSTQIQRLNKTPVNGHIERNNRTLHSGTKWKVQNADQSYGPITCTFSHRSVSMSFAQVKINKITNW